MQLFLLRTHTVSASSKAPNDLCCHPGLQRVNICQGWWAEGTLTPGGRAGFCFMWEEDCSTQVQTWMLVMWVVCTSMLVCVTGPVLWRVLGFVLCSPFPPCLHTWSFSPLVFLSFFHQRPLQSPLLCHGARRCCWARFCCLLAQFWEPPPPCSPNQCVNKANLCYTADSWWHDCDPTCSLSYMVLKQAMESTPLTLLQVTITLESS